MTKCDNRRSKQGTFPARTTSPLLAARKKVSFSLGGRPDPRRSTANCTANWALAVHLDVVLWSCGLATHLPAAERRDGAAS
jgi:hypothetical protein